MQNEPLQRTDEWYAARVGKHTASRHADATAKTKTGYGVSRTRYLGELIAERDTGQPYPSYVSQDMKWGTETEPRAKITYSMLRDVDIVEVGFVNHPTIEMSGASPDGLIGDDGLIEIKCPASHTHMLWVLGREPIPLAHIQQIQWQLICTGRKWCDWVSFDPRVRRNQMHIVRVTRVPDHVVAIMERDVMEFLDEVALAFEAWEMAAQQKEAA